MGFGQVFSPNLDFKGHLTLMMMMITICLWIFRPFGLPFSVSGGFLMAGLLTIGVPAANVFAGFSGNAVWTLIPALFFGFALSKTGLGKRIAYFGMKSISVSYPSLLTMWAIIGILLSALTPSITVRTVIVIPIALQCVQVCGLAVGSRARSLILISAWSMAVIPGTGWMSGSLAGPILSGLYAAVPELGAISFAEWAKASLLPVFLTTLLTLLLGFLSLKPEGKLSLAPDVFKKEYEKLGRMSQDEKITAAVLTASFVFFTTNAIHHIPDAAVCLTGLFILSAAKVIDSKEISVGISWDLVLFIGIAMSFGSVFAVTGLSKWMSGQVIVAIAPIAGHSWLFIFVTMLFFFLWRFVDIATFIPTMAIISSVAPAVFKTYGISPMVWVPMLCIAMNSFFLAYTNMFALIAEANMKGEGWSAAHFSRYGIMYFIAVMISMTIAIPYWKMLGYFG